MSTAAEAEAGSLSVRFGKDFVLGSVEAPRIGSFALTAGDLACFEGPRWLNDEVMNAYMCVLQIRSNVAASSAVTAHSEAEGAPPPRCLFFNSIFSMRC